MPREEPALGGKMLPLLLGFLSLSYVSMNLACCSELFARESFWGLFSFTSLELSDIASYASLSLRG